MQDGPRELNQPGGDDAFYHSLCAARKGVTEQIGELLDTCRPYLLSIAQSEFPSDLHGKLGASDLVQDTLARGVEHFGTFQGHTQAELHGWLRKILLNHLANVWKSYGTEKRQVEREQLADSALADPYWLPPSGEVAAREQSERLEAALARLPEEYQQVIRLRHRENLSFAQVGAAIGKSEDAAGKIWARALERLQKELK
jgi:RNA polymerase sigma-70 factor (ECF subfamily)